MTARYSQLRFRQVETGQFHTLGGLPISFIYNKKILYYDLIDN